MHTHEKRTHLPRQQREKIIFTSIMNCVEKHGVFKFTIPQIAQDAKCSETLIKLYFGGITSIRHKVIQFARDTNIKKILDTPIVDMLEI